MLDLRGLHTFGPQFRQGVAQAGSSGPAFLPTQVAGIQAWYRADLGVTIGTGVSSWADQSGAGDANRNAVQATGSKQPTVNAGDAAYNHQSTLSFASASTQALHTGVWTSGPPTISTVFIVGNTGAALGQAILDGNSVNNYLFEDGGSGTLAELGQSNYTTHLVTTIMSTPAVYAIEFNGASSKLYQNAITAIATAFNVGSSSPTKLSMGNKADDSGSLNGKIAEVIVYSGVLSLSDRTSLLNYLGTRYGIAIGA